MSRFNAIDSTPRTVTVRNPLDPIIRAIASRFGDKSKEVERFLRFSVVGVTGAVIDFGVLIALQATLLHPVDIDGTTQLYTFGIPNAGLASAISFTCAVLSNFFWTRNWVYPESRDQSFKRQLAQFAILSAIGGVARTIWISVMFLMLGNFFMPIALPLIQIFRPHYIPSAQAPAKLGTIIAQTIGMAFVMLWNFFANRYWTYRHVK